MRSSGRQTPVRKTLLVVVIIFPWLVMLYMLFQQTEGRTSQISDTDSLSVVNKLQAIFKDVAYSNTEGGGNGSPAQLAGGCHSMTDLLKDADKYTESFADVLNNSTSDKRFHHFGEMYAEYFDPIRFEKLNFMEIGLRQGDSIRLWKKFFPRAHLYGVDKGKVFTGFRQHTGDPFVDIFTGERHLPEDGC
eukprot:jgi/Mesen1/10917/ME000095S10252